MKSIILRDFWPNCLTRKLFYVFIFKGSRKCWFSVLFWFCNHISKQTAIHIKMSQPMRLWYLSHGRPAKAQANLRIRAVSPEPSLFAHMKYGSRQRVRPKNQTSSLTWWLHMRLKMRLRMTKSTIILWYGSKSSEQVVVRRVTFFYW